MFQDIHIAACLLGVAPGFTPELSDRQGATRGATLEAVCSLLHTNWLYQITSLCLSLLAPIADNRSGALTRAERSTGLAPRIASEKQNPDFDAVCPDEHSLRAYTEISGQLDARASPTQQEVKQVSGKWFCSNSATAGSSRSRERPTLSHGILMTTML